MSTSSSIETIKSFDDLPIMLKVEAAGKVLGISRATAYELANSDGFPVIKIGKRLLVPRDALRVWIEQNTGKSNKAVGV